MTTQDLIKRLRNLGPLGKIMEELVIIAADRLEELHRLNDSMQVDRDLWIKVGREKLEAVERERDEARAEVERLVKERNQAQAEIMRLQAGFEVHSKFAKERDEARADVERLKQKLHDARIENSGQAAQLERTRPEPSRLEIAAMLMGAHVYHLGLMYQEGLTLRQACFIEADALIAAAKEGK